MAKTQSSSVKSGAKGKAKGKVKGKKGKMPLGQRVLIGAAVLGLAWYLYTKQKAKKQAEEQKKIIAAGGGYQGGYQGHPDVGYGVNSGGLLDPNTGLPCSAVFGGCPDGGVIPGAPPGGPITWPSSEISGCLSPTANNYNPAATIDDGSCSWENTGDDIYGCMDNNATNYNQLATIPEISPTDSGDPCTYPVSRYRCDSGGCLECPPGTSESVCPHLEDTCADSCGVTIFGCTDSLATNYDPNATSDDGSCVLPSISCDMCDNGAPISNMFNADQCPEGWIPSGSGNPCAGLMGCTDPSAQNYNASAQYDDGGCTYMAQTQTINCFTECPTPQSVQLTVPTGTTCEQADYQENLVSNAPQCAQPQGCTSPGATNYDPSASVDDGSCTFPAISCDSCGGGYPTSQMFNLPNCPSGTIPSGSGNPCAGQNVDGCIDPAANNYNSAATSDDGSCTYNTVTCYQCNGSSQVGWQFNAASCPSGWQATVPNCSQGKQVSCDSCSNGAAISNMFSGSCPSGWIPSGTGNPCSATSGGGGTGGGEPGGGGASSFSGFAGERGDTFGRWQRNLATKIAINDTDWNPTVSE